jgi:hypothetical protein
MNAAQTATGRYSIASILMDGDIVMRIENELTGEIVVMPVTEIALNADIIKRMTPEDALLVGVWYGHQRVKEGTNYLQSLEAA